MANSTVCTASVWPHRHTDELTGPLDVKISYRHQPPIVQDWPKDMPVWVQLEQPDERTNLTILKLVFNRLDNTRAGTRINQCRIQKDNSLKFYIKARITNKMEHPIPRGRWQGVCDYEDSWCLFTFQAMTMRVKPKEQRIVLPDGSLPTEKNIKTRIVLP